MNITAIYNCKGGAGKTSVTAALAAVAAAQGQRVLAIDADPQANLTAWTGHAEQAANQPCLSDVIGGQADLDATICQGTGPWTGVDVIPAHPRMEVFVRHVQFGQELDLKRILSHHQDGYDTLLIDCPPNAGFLTLSALIAAHQVIIPTRPSRFSTDGVIQAFETIGYITERQNPTLQVRGVLIVGVFAGQSTSILTEQELRESLDHMVFTQTIPHRTAMTKAEDARLPINQLRDKGADDLIRAFTHIHTQLQEPTP